MTLHGSSAFQRMVTSIDRTDQRFAIRSGHRCFSWSPTFNDTIDCSAADASLTAVLFYLNSERRLTLLVTFVQLSTHFLQFALDLVQSLIECVDRPMGLFK